MHFFQLMTRRYERASTVLTSNKSFEEWPLSLATSHGRGARRSRGVPLPPHHDSRQ